MKIEYLIEFDINTPKQKLYKAISICMHSMR
jgi:hypothetical protein